MCVAPALLGGSCTHSKQKATLPNIIVIMTDDLGYGGLGSYGAKKIPSPHTGRLTREGIRFTYAHSPSSVCSPTRYSVLSGEYAWRSWLKNWVLMKHMPLLIDTAQLTLPKLLKQQGYRTGAILLGNLENYKGLKKMPPIKPRCLNLK